MTEKQTIEVHFFKPSGKWYTTETIGWTEGTGTLCDELAWALREHLKQENGEYRLSGMTAVCTQFPGDRGHPMMMKVDMVEAILSF